MRPGRGTFILEKIRGKRNDIYASQSIKEFTESLSQAILQQIPEQKSIGKRFLDLLKGFHPILSYDALTGQPEISFEFTEQKGAEKTLAAIFQFLETQDRRILIAIDEFQQIANYPETNTEALLRSYIQQLKNVRFIFSGSNKHMMNELFNSAKRPFFSSTQMMPLAAFPITFTLLSSRINLQSQIVRLVTKPFIFFSRGHALILIIPKHYVIIYMRLS